MDGDDSPGVKIPPPTFFVLSYILGYLLQEKLPCGNHFIQNNPLSKVIGDVFIVASLVMGFSALFQFIKTHNTFITTKPATTLQTSGVYAISRNPMYTGLFFFYLGLTFMMGSWWHLILLPLLYWIFKKYIIKREEAYLQRKFGQEYLNYQAKVRRWL